MIAVFNQVKTPWIIKKKQDSDVVLFSKLKTITNEHGDRRYFLRVEMSPSFLEEPNITEELSKCIHMGSVRNISDTNITTIFDRKTFDPHVNKSNKHSDQQCLLLMSLFTRHSRVVRVDTTDVFVLDTLNIEDMYGQIVVFNKNGSRLTVTTHDSERETIIVHDFTFNNGKIKHDTVTSKGPWTGAFTNPKKFKPAMLPYALVAIEEHAEALQTIVTNKEKDPDKFSIFVMDKGENIAPIIMKEKFKAVGLYVPNNQRKKPEWIQCMSLLKQYFKVFFLIDENGKVSKIRVS